MLGGDAIDVERCNQVQVDDVAKVVERVHFAVLGNRPFYDAAARRVDDKVHAAKRFDGFAITFSVPS
jgi:hypothetical protein